MTALFETDTPDPNAKPAAQLPGDAADSGNADVNALAVQSASAAAAEERRRRLGQGRPSTILTGQYSVADAMNMQPQDPLQPRATRRATQPAATPAQVADAQQTQRNELRDWALTGPG